MDYDELLELAMELGYQLQMCGAETYRVEESINRLLNAYGVQGEVFAIPNSLIVSMDIPNERPRTRMRRIPYHGTDLDSVEQFNGLCRRLYRFQRRQLAGRSVRWNLRRCNWLAGALF